jgi:hypothetical protein
MQNEMASWESYRCHIQQFHKKMSPLSKDLLDHCFCYFLAIFLEACLAFSVDSYEQTSVCVPADMLAYHSWNVGESYNSLGSETENSLLLNIFKLARLPSDFSLWVLESWYPKDKLQRAHRQHVHLRKKGSREGFFHQTWTFHMVPWIFFDPEGGTNPMCQD